jgi:hypothetical protein
MVQINKGKEVLKMTYNEIGILMGLILLFAFLLIATVRMVHGNIKQYTDSRCVVCKGMVDWDLVKREFEDMFEQLDYHGIDSLTENEQVVLENRCCSIECFEEMDIVIIEA